MFHHQKSSRSSDDNLQINLLQAKERDSRINFVRVQPRNLLQFATNMTQKPNRGSQHIKRSTQFKNDIEPNVYDNYSALENVDFSQSFLTNSNNNNSVVGVILFILLIIFTPLQTFVLYTSQQVLQVTNFLHMAQFLIICQLVAFGLLYYFKWVQNIRILTNYLRSAVRGSQDPSANIISKIIQRPYLLFIITIIITIFWQISYVGVLLQHQQIEHYIVFYVIILPQIADSLYFQQQLHKNTALKWCFYLVLGYLMICAALINQWLLINGLCGLVLIYLSIRAGRMCLFMEYITKCAMLLVVIVMHIFIPQHWQENQYNPDDYYYDESSWIQTAVVMSIFSCICIIIVRCINNKVLRVELYKYFYSDTFINNALLCLPIILGYLQNYMFDLWVGLIGCGALFVIGYKVGKNKEMISLEGN